jgi:uncharacterized protein (DUF4415 family)
MATKNGDSASNWVDPDDAPELTDEWFARAELRVGGELVRRGRPKAEAPKKMTTIRLDADVLEFYRATGPGWQGRVNQLLRKAAGL